MGDELGEKFNWAVKNGDLDIVKSTLKENPNSNLVKEAHRGRTPLQVAADYGQTDVLSFLIIQGADVNEADKHGISPLLAAIYEGHTECVQLLLEKGAKKDGKAPDGSSFLECAEKEEIKKLLQ